MAGEDLHQIKTDTATNAVAWHPTKYILAYSTVDSRTKNGTLHVWNGEVGHSYTKSRVDSSTSYSRRPVVQFPNRTYR
jgi:hypothetical protein